MRKLLLLALLSLNLACPGQSATVVFYTAPVRAKDYADAIIPAGTMPFIGWLYDSSSRLAHFKQGSILVMRFEPGTHIFSASANSKNPSSKTLSLNLESGSQYCVRLSAKYVN